MQILLLDHSCSILKKILGDNSNAWSEQTRKARFSVVSALDSIVSFVGEIFLRTREAGAARGGASDSSRHSTLPLLLERGEMTIMRGESTSSYSLLLDTRVMDHRVASSVGHSTHRMADIWGVLGRTFFIEAAAKQDLDTLLMTPLKSSAEDGGITEGSTGEL